MKSIDFLLPFHKNYASELQLAVKYLVKNPLNKAYETLQLVLILNKNPIRICDLKCTMSNEEFAAL